MPEQDRHDPNDPIQDLIDYEEHRYDPGYWTREWARKARFSPSSIFLRKQRLSSFYKALLMTLVLGLMPFVILLNLRDSLPHARLYYAAALVVLSFGLWYFIHRSMARTHNRPASGEIHHSNNRNDHEHT
jgi:hypothetical protein